MRSFVLAILVSCSPAKAPVPEMPNHALKFEGTITDFNFGCWADKDCGVKVDDVWIMIEGGMRGEPGPPKGQLVGIHIAGGDDPNKQKGMHVEVFAQQMPVYDASMNIAGYDPKRLTLTGDAAYYVRAK